MNYTKGKWKVGNESGITGPTTPASPSPVCGGEDWPYQVITVGKETIAVCPAQDSLRKSHKFRPGEPLIDEMEANAHLISAAPDMYEALGELLEITHDLTLGDGSPDPQVEAANRKARQARAKAEGKENDGN